MSYSPDIRREILQGSQEPDLINNYQNAFSGRIDREPVTFGQEFKVRPVTAKSRVVNQDNVNRMLSDSALPRQLGRYQHTRPITSTTQCTKSSL